MCRRILSWVNHAAFLNKCCYQCIRTFGYVKRYFYLPPEILLMVAVGFFIFLRDFFNCHLYSLLNSDLFCRILLNYYLLLLRDISILNFICWNLEVSNERWTIELLEVYVPVNCIKWVVCISFSDVIVIYTVLFLMLIEGRPSLQIGPAIVHISLYILHIVIYIFYTCTYK